MKLFRQSLLLLFMCYSVQLFATHIVGGVIYYEYIGGNQYDLIFKIYRDCEVINGVANAPFDGDVSTNGNGGPSPINNFYFGIYEGTTDGNVLSSALRYIQFDASSKQIVSSSISSSCLTPNGTCIQEATYRKRITLPSSSLGYTIVYERCCRNASILNISSVPDPTSPSGLTKPGITLMTYIPPTTTYHNTSAVFTKLPPTFICVNQTFYFDHSATDADGDQLTYSLSLPKGGLNAQNPWDSLPLLSKAFTLNLSAPYSLTNYIGGTPALSIDPNTGLLICKPNVEGRYVISIQVKETRNGVVIDSFSREMQINVVQCNIPNADMPYVSGTLDIANKIAEYPINCKSLNMTFKNNSSNGSNVKYYWKFGDPTTGTNDTSTQINPTHLYSAAGTYTVTLYALLNTSSGQLCIDSTRRIVNIYPGFLANFSAPNSCVGTPIRFTDLSISKFGTVNQWNWDFSNGGTSTVQNPLFTFNTAGTYPVKLTAGDTKKCSLDTTINILIYPKPTITTSVSNVCIGQSSNLISTSSIVSPYSIIQNIWRLSDGSVLIGSPSLYTFTTLGNQTVTLVSISNLGCRDSADFSLTVNPKPVVSATNDTTICYDQKVKLNVTGAQSYLWFPASLLDNATSQTPTASLTYPTSSKIVVKGTSQYGCINYDSLVVSFYTKPFISAGLDTSVCLDPSPFKYKDSVQLNGQGTFTTVYWTPTTGLSNPNIANPTAKPSSNTDYIFNGIDNHQCLIKDTVTVTVLDPSINLITLNTATLCWGDSIQVNPVNQGNITTYAWSPSYWVSDANIRNPWFKPLDTQLYILTVINYCYAKSDSINLLVIPQPKPIMKRVDSVCYGESYQFNVGSWVTYKWAANSTLSNTTIANPIATPKVTNTYYVTITDVYGCIGNDSSQILVHYPPALSLVGLKRFLCLGDSLYITALTDIFSIYKWTPNVYISSDTARSIYCYPLDTTKYTISVTSISKCTTIDSFKINVQKPVVVSTVSPVRFCKGKYVFLDASGAIYYRWLTQTNINDTLSNHPQVYPDSTTTYVVEGSNNCFKDTGYVLVNVDTLPKIKASDDSTIFRGASIELSVTGNVNTFEWTPKELFSNPFGPSQIVSPLDTTLFYVYGTDLNGCMSKDSVWVYVYGKNVLLLPTGFSPNGDGVNDLFRVAKYLNIKRLNKFMIYNRWGELVYESDDITKGWDGTYKEMPCDAGVYVWYIDAINYDKESIKKSGNVTLIR